MPNSFSYLALAVFPVLAFYLFRKAPLRTALIWTIVAGYLLLPTRAGWNPPGFPTIDKNFVAAVSALVMCIVAYRWMKRPISRADRAENAKVLPRPTLEPFRAQRGQVMLVALLILLFLTPFITVLQNPEPIFNDNGVMAGLRPYDALSICATTLITILPFLLARRFLNTEASHLLLLQVIVVSGLAYSLLALYEVRMSPQLNRMLYGFFPHNWMQHVRGGEYRPLVFLNHGLWLAIQMTLACVASFALFRVSQTGGKRFQYLVAGIFLLGVVYLTRSLGPLALALLFIPLVVFVPRRVQALISAVIALMIITYPVLRSSNLIPVEEIHAYVLTIDENRAGSLRTRLDNEDNLMEHAQAKPLAGWGGWGRSRVRNEKGRDVSLTDGYWVIVLGVSGWLGYIAEFGLLTLPMIFMGLRNSKYKLPPATSALTLVFAVMLVDQIPNATIGPVMWLMAGAILGFYQTVPHSKHAAAEKPVSVKARNRANSRNSAPPATAEPVKRQARTQQLRRQPRAN